MNIHSEVSSMLMDDAKLLAAELHQSPSPNLQPGRPGLQAQTLFIELIC